MNVTEQRALPHRITHAIQGNQLLGLPVRRREIDLRAGAARPRVHLRQFRDHFVRLIDPRFRFRSPRLRPSAQPINLRMHAILQRLLPVPLRMQIQFLGFQERAVISGHA